MALHGLANATHGHDNGSCLPIASTSVSATPRDGAAASSAPPPSTSGRRPILLLDVMDTIVYDPFFIDMPKHFGITFKELMAAKHPSAWVEYERGLIDEEQLGQKFFSDARPCDIVALRQAMVSCYRYLDGMEPLLARLKDAGYEMHAMSNYPAWFKFIEDKLQLSRYLCWTFISCEGPMKGLRKPSLEAYEVAVRTLQVPPTDLLLVDDRKGNTDGAAAAGMGAILFKDAAQLEDELRARGLEF